MMPVMSTMAPNPFLPPHSHQEMQKFLAAVPKFPASQMTMPSPTSIQENGNYGPPSRRGSNASIPDWPQQQQGHRGNQNWGRRNVAGGNVSESSSTSDQQPVQMPRRFHNQMNHQRRNHQGDRNYGGHRMHQNYNYHQQKGGNFGHYRNGGGNRMNNNRHGYMKSNNYYNQQQPVQPAQLDVSTPSNVAPESVDTEYNPEEMLSMKIDRKKQTQKCSSSELDQPLADTSAASSK